MKVDFFNELSYDVNTKLLYTHRKDEIMEKFGIEIIDPTGKAPVRAFIGDDDFLWSWINIRTDMATKGEILVSVPEGYCVRDGAIVPRDPKANLYSITTSAVLNIENMGVTKAHMVAKGLKETTRDQFSKQGVSQSRIMAVIPI